MKSEIVLDDLLANLRQASARAGNPRRGARPNEINALTVKRLRGWTRERQSPSQPGRLYPLKSGPSLLA